MITNTLTELAEAASKRYDLVLDSFILTYREAVSPEGMRKRDNARHAGIFAAAMMRTHLDAELFYIKDDIERIAEIATQDALKSLNVDAHESYGEAIDELVIDSIAYLKRELETQGHRDIATLQKSVQSMILHIRISASAMNVEPHVAAFNYAIGVDTDPNFVFRDRRAARWRSGNFVRTVWRQTLLNIYNEIFLLVLAEHGESRASVITQDAKNQYSDMTISMMPNTQDPVYAEIRDVVFHPNANAVIGRAM